MWQIVAVVLITILIAVFIFLWALPIVSILEESLRESADNPGDSKEEIKKKK